MKEETGRRDFSRERCLKGSRRDVEKEYIGLEEMCFSPVMTDANLGKAGSLSKYTSRNEGFGKNVGKGSSPLLSNGAGSLLRRSFPTRFLMLLGVPWLRNMAGMHPGLECLLSHFFGLGGENKKLRDATKVNRDSPKRAILEFGATLVWISGERSRPACPQAFFYVLRTLAAKDEVLLGTVEEVGLAACSLWGLCSEGENQSGGF